MTDETPEDPAKRRLLNIIAVLAAMLFGGLAGKFQLFMERSAKPSGKVETARRSDALQ